MRSEVATRLVYTRVKRGIDPVPTRVTTSHKTRMGENDPVLWRGVVLVLGDPLGSGRRSEDAGSGGPHPRQSRGWVLGNRPRLAATGSFHVRGDGLFPAPRSEPLAHLQGNPTPPALISNFAEM